MSLRWTRICVILPLIWMALAYQSLAQDEEYRRIRAELRSSNFERMYATLESMAALDNGMPALLPDLMFIIERADYPATDMAIRAVANLKSQASPAVPILCKRLDDKLHTTRSLAVDALVVIGEDSVGPLRNVLQVRSPRARAAAIEALGRLDRLDLLELDALSQDDDPRVRVAATCCFSRSGKAAVSRLVSLLSDRDIVVAVEAARGLGSNHADSTLAINGLISALSRPNLGAPTADALASYGVEAQAAIPSLLRAYPLGESERYESEDAIDAALSHIGPPREQDISTVGEFLTHSSVDLRILAAECLARLGTKGAAIAPALKTAAESTAKQYGLAKKRPSAKSASEQDEEHWYKELVFAEYCADAFWRVTKDPVRYLELIERIVLEADDQIDFLAPSPWTSFPTEVCPLLEKMLHHSNDTVRATALQGMGDMGPKCVSLKNSVVAIANSPNSEISPWADRALLAMGPEAADVALPGLLTLYRQNKIDANDFCEAAKCFDARTPEVLDQLEKGLNGTDESTVRACAEALCALTNDPKRIAATVIKKIESGQLDVERAMEALQDLKSADDIVVPFLVRQLDADDYAVRYYAIEALGKMAERAVPALTQLKARLSDEDSDCRLAAAKATYFITKDATQFGQLLKSMIERRGSGDPSERYQAIFMIGEMKNEGSQYIPIVVEELRSGDPDGAAAMIHVLTNIGSPAAVAALEEVSKSPDWMLRSAAIQGLETLRNRSNASK